MTLLQQSIQKIKRTGIFFVAACGIFLQIPVQVQAQIKHPLMPQAPEIAARSFLLMDITSNQVLAERGIDTPVEPASLTKLMTAYLVFDALKSKKIDLHQTLPVSERAWKMEGSRMFIDPSMRVPVEDLIKGMIVQSGNDATNVLAEGVGGDILNFVRLMNQQAARLGMTRTTYKNAEGLTAPGHLTTARDLSTLANRLMVDFPQYTSYYAIKNYHYQNTPTSNDTNRNLLLFRDPSVDGLKTGHTDAAGYCLIATAKREFPNLGQGGAPGNRRLLAIVLGTQSANDRANEAQKLLNWGYTAFEAVKLFDANQAIVTPLIWKGAKNNIKLGTLRPLVVAVPSGTSAVAGKLTTQITRPDYLLAPAQEGKAVGSINIKLNNQLLLEVPLLALETVQPAGIFGRTWDGLRLLMK